MGGETRHHTVPLIDLAPLLAGGRSERISVAQAIGRACEDIGFFTITGHGVDPGLVERMDRVSRAFFDLPLADKRRVARPKPEQSRGYIGVGEENLAYGVGTATTDLKEFFAIGPVDVPDEPYYTAPAAYPSFAPNVWPERPAELRAVYTAYYRAMERLAAAVMRAFALALDLPEGFFADKTDRHISGIRVINYPDQPEAPAAGQLRAGAHSDYGALTILKAENVPGGLQVLNRTGDWVDVEPPAGAFVVNIGDLMMHWTNDRWVSTLHRVVNPPRDVALGSRRQSVVFFYQPNYDAVIECLPSCSGPGHPSRYAPVTSGEHRLRKFLRTVSTAPGPADGRATPPKISQPGNN
jgi:isopenicillin N synthase-like dioxygenase